VGGQDSEELLVAQAQAEKVMTARTTAASSPAADGSQARKRRASSVRGLPRETVVLKSRSCQAAEVLVQLVKKCRMVSAAAAGRQNRQAGD
jgi:hypothetical protein